MNRETFTCQLIPLLAGGSAAWSYIQNAPTEQSLLFLLAGLLSYGYGSRRAAGELVRELDGRERDDQITEIWTRMSEIERDVREDIDKAEERLDAQVDIIMSKMNS